MQQLTLQFDGYADDCRQPIGVTATTQRKRSFKANELSFGWAMKQKDVIAAIHKVGGNLVLYAQGAFFVAFAFGLMYFAAIFGG